MGEIWKRKRNQCPQNPQARLEPTTVPGSLCLLIWDSGCFMFYYWWPKAKATNKCLCWQQGASFPGLPFRGGKSCFKAHSLCMVSIFFSCHAKVKTELAPRLENSALSPPLGPLEDRALFYRQDLSLALALFSFSRVGFSSVLPGCQDKDHI